jgi:hypothetical protein
MKSPEIKRRLRVAPLVIITAMSVLGTTLILPSAIRAGADDEVTTFTIDVATDIATNTQNNVNPRQSPDLFARGDTFILSGNIYPGGTLPSGKANNDPNAPGSIGKYRVVGTFSEGIENFERAVAGLPASPVIAIGDEIFSLPNDGTTIATSGLWPNAHFSARRVVLGGTGNYREIVGEAIEQNIGENAGGFCNFRITFRIRKAALRP